MSHLSAIEQQMRILVTPREALADRRMLSIHNHEQAHICVAYHKSRDPGRHRDQAGSNSLSFQKRRNIP